MTNCKAICANWVGGWRKTPVRVVATRARGDSETSQIRFCWINLFSYRPPLTGDLQIVKLWESEFSRITCISYRNTTWHKSQVLSSLAYVMQEAPYPIIFDTPLPTHYKKKTKSPAINTGRKSYFIWEVLLDPAIEQKARQGSLEESDPPPSWTGVGGCLPRLLLWQ